MPGWMQLTVGIIVLLTLSWLLSGGPGSQDRED